MNGDLISREAAIDALIRAKEPKNKGDGTVEITILTDGAIRDVINKIPTAHPEPPKTGKWVIRVIWPPDGEDCYCSECGKGECLPNWKYCPHCGARMEGTDDD